MRLGCKASSKTQAWRAEIEVAGLCQSLAFSEVAALLQCRTGYFRALSTPYRPLERRASTLNLLAGETVVLRCATAAPRMDEPRMGEKWINDV